MILLFGLFGKYVENVGKCMNMQSGQVLFAELRFSECHFQLGHEKSHQTRSHLPILLAEGYLLVHCTHQLYAVSRTKSSICHSNQTLMRLSAPQVVAKSSPSDGQKQQSKVFGIRCDIWSRQKGFRLLQLWLVRLLQLVRLEHISTLSSIKALQ